MLLAPYLMHIPDGFLSITVSAVLWIVTILVVAYTLKRVNIFFDASVRMPDAASGVVFGMLVL